MARFRVALSSRRPGLEARPIAALPARRAGDLAPPPRLRASEHRASENERLIVGAEM